MLKGGNDPLHAFQPESEEWKEPAPLAKEATGSLGTREIELYFTAEDGHWLSPETTAIEYSPHTVENCRKALQALIAGPKKEYLFPALPSQTKIRALYLEDKGDLVLDLSSEMQATDLRPQSAEMEALMIYGIINTMTQPALQGENDPSVQTIRFLFDGVPPRDGFPAHLDLSLPLTQDKRWTQVLSE
jgi:spore germination protein GerM